MLSVFVAVIASADDLIVTGASVGPPSVLPAAPVWISCEIRQLVRTMRLSIDSLAIRSLGGTKPSRVVFAGTPLTATVTLAVAALPGATVDPEGGVDLPSVRWWEKLTWDVHRDGTAAGVPVRTSLIAHQGSPHHMTTT